MLLFLSFDLEQTMFEYGCFMLFVGSLCMAICMVMLQLNTNQISIKSRTPVLKSGVIFYSMATMFAVVLRENVMQDLIAQSVTLALGVSACVFAGYTIPFVIKQAKLAFDVVNSKKIQDVLKQFDVQ